MSAQYESLWKIFNKFAHRWKHLRSCHTEPRNFSLALQITVNYTINIAKCARVPVQLMTTVQQLPFLIFMYSNPEIRGKIVETREGEGFNIRIPKQTERKTQ